MRRSAHLQTHCLGDTESINEHQDDDGGNGHACHAKAEDGMGGAFTKEPFK